MKWNVWKHVGVKNVGWDSLFGIRLSNVLK
jgi:hypothetical protein